MARLLRGEIRWADFSPGGGPSRRGARPGPASGKTGDSARFSVARMDEILARNRCEAFSRTGPIRRPRHAAPGTGIFILASFLTVALALLSVSGNVLKASLANPVDSLRHE